MYPIGQAIRLATMGTVDDDRYSQPTRFITSVLFGLLRSGGGVGGGAIVLAAVCRCSWCLGGLGWQALCVFISFEWWEGGKRGTKRQRQ